MSFSRLTKWSSERFGKPVTPMSLKSTNALSIRRCIGTTSVATPPNILAGRKTIPSVWVPQRWTWTKRLATVIGSSATLVLSDTLTIPCPPTGEILSIARWVSAIRCLAAVTLRNTLVVPTEPVLLTATSTVIVPPAITSSSPTQTGSTRSVTVTRVLSTVTSKLELNEQVHMSERSVDVEVIPPLTVNMGSSSPLTRLREIDVTSGSPIVTASERETVPFPACCGGVASPWLGALKVGATSLTELSTKTFVQSTVPFGVPIDAKVSSRSSSVTVER